MLDPSGSAWKAFVVESTSNVTLSTIKSLQHFASSGLPVILVGGSPGFYPTGTDTNVTEFEEQLVALQAYEGVYSVGKGQLADQLSALGLSPRVAVTTNGTWYTTWHEAEGAGHAFIFADLAESQGEITISDTRTPFFLNPWTGEKTPVLIYKQDGNSTIIPLYLGGNQTAIISFDDTRDGSNMSAYNVVSSPPGVIGANFDPSTGLALHVTAAVDHGYAVLSNNATCALDGSQVPETFELSEWELIAEHWEAPSNVSSSLQPTVKFNTTHFLPSLRPWTEIPALVNASGVGYYTSNFTWPSSNTSDTTSTQSIGAHISFANVTHSLRVQVNGNDLGPLDLTHATADISSYLRPGTNTVTAIVPTTWWNYLETILGTLESSGAQPLPLVLNDLLGVPMPPKSKEGLMPGIRVTPFKRVIC